MIQFQYAKKIIILYPPRREAIAIGCTEDHVIIYDPKECMLEKELYSSVEFKPGAFEGGNLP